MFLYKYFAEQRRNLILPLLNTLFLGNRSRSLSLDSPNRKRAEVSNAPVGPVLPENDSTMIHANNLES